MLNENQGENDRRRGLSRGEVENVRTSDSVFDGISSARQSAVVPPWKRPILEKFDHHGEACEARSSIRESWLATDDDMQSRFRWFARLSPTTTTTTTRWMLCENEKRTESDWLRLFKLEDLWAGTLD